MASQLTSAFVTQLREMNESCQKREVTLIHIVPSSRTSLSIIAGWKVDVTVKKWDVPITPLPFHTSLYLTHFSWIEKQPGFCGTDVYVLMNDRVNTHDRSLEDDDLWPSSAKRKRSGLGSMVRLRFPSSPLPSLSTFPRSIRQKSIATSSSRGRKRLTAALIITSLLSSRRSARHSSPFLWREDLQRGIKVEPLHFCSVIVKKRDWVGKKKYFSKSLCAVPLLKYPLGRGSVSESVCLSICVSPCLNLNLNKALLWCFTSTQLYF